MTVQIVEIAGQKMAMLPVADYERLIDLVEDRADAQAAARAEERRQAGEEYIPADVVDRIVAGENALQVWRKFRGMTQAELSAKADLSGATMSHLETGKRGTSAKNWRALAEALSVDIDDIMPFD